MYDYVYDYVYDYDYIIYCIVEVPKTKPFDNNPSHSMCCHLAIGTGTKIIPIQ